MNNSTSKISTLNEAVADVLHYFALFKYPLTASEIHRFMAKECTMDKLLLCLEAMTAENEIHRSEHGFYCPSDTREWFHERALGNQRAEHLLATSFKYVRVMKRFPFVKGIAISGSLSKYYGEENADIDYFIITRKNRLWIARTLLHVYKKLTFLRGHQHFYCMNYFVDETALEIQHKNIYTAIELATLIPVYNAHSILELKESNLWVSDFLPNHVMDQDERFLVSERIPILKRAAETFLELLWPESMNQRFMKMTDRKWRRKWQKANFPMEQYDHAFLTTLHVSKNHPANYQKQVLASLKKENTHINPVACKA